MSEPERDFTLLDDGRPVAVSAGVREDGVRLSPRAVEALGWRLEPEGLCREGLCVPLPAGASRAAPDGISLHVRAGELAPHDFTIRRGTMPIRGIDPMGPGFRAMLQEWVGAGKAYYRPLRD